MAYVNWALRELRKETLFTFGLISFEDIATTEHTKKLVTRHQEAGSSGLEQKVEGDNEERLVEYVSLP